MSVAAVLAPLFVQVALTFVLLFTMAAMRVRAVTGRVVKPRDVVLGQPNWPERATKVGNCYHNQLQLPLLFYVLVVLALFTRQADLLFVILSWLFVLSRIVHAVIHAGVNDIAIRFYAFATGAVILLIMWVIFALRILAASALPPAV